MRRFNRFKDEMEKQKDKLFVTREKKYGSITGLVEKVILCENIDSEPDIGYREVM